MQASAGLGDAAAGLLASANFAGYLVGALAILLLPGGERRSTAPVGFALVLAGSVVMAGPTALWLPGRAAAGFGGALLFLAGTARAAGGLERAGRSGLIGLVFSGVGMGILAGGALALAILPDWRAGWLWATLAAACCWPLLARGGAPVGGIAPAAAVGGSGSLSVGRSLAAVGLAYGCAGFAFGAGATFFVSAFGAGDPARATLAWIVAGAVAIPSTLLWSGLGRRFGMRSALALAIGLLAVGTGLGALDNSPRNGVDRWSPYRRHIHGRDGARNGPCARACTLCCGAGGRPGHGRLWRRPNRGPGNLGLPTRDGRPRPGSARACGGGASGLLGARGRRRPAAAPDFGRPQPATTAGPTSPRPYPDSPDAET